MNISISGKLRYTILATLLLGITLLGLSNSQLITNKLHAFSLLPKNEQIIELYFTRPSLVPVDYMPGQELKTVFTISNATQSPQTLTYHYIVRSESGEEINIKTATVTLQPSGRQDVHLSFTPADYGPQANFSIQLADHRQQINFWAKRR